MKTYYKKVSEKIIEGLLMLSGTITSLTVLLIVFFLFREGLGLFNKKPVEETIVVAINKSNTVKDLTSLQIKNIFDQKITNWSELGGKKDSIILFRMEDITNYYTEGQIGANFENLPACISNVVDSIPGVIAFFSDKYLAKDFKGQLVEIEKIKVGEFLNGREWLPTAQPTAQLGVKPLILGTLWVSFGAILLALPLGLAAAIYLSEIADDRV
ncbi:MAG TPA: substrate-binding domain-containing protein, partial [Bacteroidia bacterium]|nr:substrate-binding domain-containing protein [Bacteroidia bacterium]